MQCQLSPAQNLFFAPGGREAALIVRPFAAASQAQGNDGHVRVDADWLILDNLTLIMVNILEAEHYHPLFALNQRGVSILASANARDRIAGPL